MVAQDCNADEPPVRFRIVCVQYFNFHRISFHKISDTVPRAHEVFKKSHTREAYLELVDLAYKKIPGVSLSTDMITGFCGEVCA